MNPPPKHPTQENVTFYAKEILLSKLNPNWTKLNSTQGNSMQLVLRLDNKLTENQTHTTPPQTFEPLLAKLMSWNWHGHSLDRSDKHNLIRQT